MKRLLIYAGAWLISSCLPALAGEAELPVPVPSPTGTFTPGTYIQSLALRVNNQQATIRYRLANRNTPKIKGNATIYGPIFTWAGNDATYIDRHFPDLEADLNTRKLVPTLHVFAYLDGVDVTRRLVHHKIDPLLIGQREGVPIKRLADKSYASVIQDGLVLADQGALMPNWYVQASHTWAISVDTQAQDDIIFKYTLRPGFEPLRLNDTKLLALIAGHCATFDQLKAALSQNGQPLPEFVVAQVYKIPVGFGSATLPESIDIDFKQDNLWSGLSAAASFACKGDGTDKAIEGKASFKNTLNGPFNEPLSILVIFPQ